VKAFETLTRTACRSGLSWGSMLEWAMASATELVSAQGVPEPDADCERVVVPDTEGEMLPVLLAVLDCEGVPDEVCDGEPLAVVLLVEV